MSKRRATTDRLPQAPARRLAAALGRLNLLAISCALGVGLVAVSVRNYTDAQRASEGFSERQGLSLFRSLQLQLGAPRADLRSQFERAVASGEVKSLALWVGPSRELSVGSSRFPHLPPTPWEFQFDGGRGRMSFRAHPSSPSSRVLPSSEPGSDPNGDPSQGPSERVIVMEFTPLGTMEFAQRAMLSLWLSVGAGLLLTSAAVVVWRLGERERGMLQQLHRQQHLATLGELSAVLAHELKNPLTALKGNAQLLAEDAATERAQAQSQRVVDSIARLEAVVRDLLAFARSGQVRPTSSSPGALLRAAVDATGPGRIDVDTAAAPDRWPLDERRLQQGLVTVLENALQVTPAGQSVRAAVARDERYLVFSVQDGGPGVPAAERARIFEPFYTTRLHGTGLGLAIAKRIAELHGGHIEVADGPRGGATFRMKIPLSPVFPETVLEPEPKGWVPGAPAEGAPSRAR